MCSALLLSNCVYTEVTFECRWCVYTVAVVLGCCFLEEELLVVFSLQLQLHREESSNSIICHVFHVFRPIYM